jgi:hypothetical protein
VLQQGMKSRARKSYVAPKATTSSD